jgi:hypothetical protein
MPFPRVVTGVNGEAALYADWCETTVILSPQRDGCATMGTGWPSTRLIHLCGRGASELGD